MKRKPKPKEKPRGQAPPAPPRRARRPAALDPLAGQPGVPAAGSVAAVPPFRLPPVQPPPDDGDGGDPDGDDGLNPRQRAFVLALTTPGRCFGVAARAAEAAGYRADNSLSLRVTASRLLTNANVRRAVREALAKLRNDPLFRQNLVLTRASVTMEDFLTFDDKGQPEIDWAAAAAAGALSSVKKYREDLHPESGAVVRRTVELYDAMAGQKLLAQLEGKIKDPATGAAIVPPITVNVNLLGEEEA